MVNAGLEKGVIRGMLADVLQVSPHTIIRRTRRLPLAGRVLVSDGDAVRPEDVIAEASFPAKVVTLDLSRGLGISPTETDACVVREPGDQLKEGDLIAQCEGALTRLVRSPSDGFLVDISHGRAILATGTEVVRVRAEMIGFVEEVIPEFGVILTSECSLVQGVWGNGLAGAGLLGVVGDPKEEPVDGEVPETVGEGKILALVSCFDLSGLHRLINLGPAGLIFGTLATELIPTARQLAIPVIVLQGFGDLPPDPVSIDMLASREGAMTSLNAIPCDLYQGHRPEVTIPYGEGEPEADLGLQTQLTVGQCVRILSGEAIGQTGEIVALVGAEVFESGLHGPAARIKLPEGEEVQLPQQNLTILH